MTLLVFLLLHTFVGRTYAVQQLSMEPTLEPDQRLIVDRFTPWFDPYKPGDIVVFEAPQTGRSEPFIKRVVATAGSTVQIVDGQVFVDGVALDEPYTFEGEPTQPLTLTTSWIVPSGQLFVLGDHRSLSADSRSFGPIEISTIVGRAWLRFYPFEDAALLSAVDSP